MWKDLLYLGSIELLLFLQALSTERTASYKQLEASLAKANAEKADLADRVRYLEIRLEEAWIPTLQILSQLHVLCLAWRCAFFVPMPLLLVIQDTLQAVSAFLC